MIKNFVIFGDSYSTHKDHIPEGYAAYYSDEGRGPDAPVTKMKAEQTWWWRFKTRVGAELVFNNSWSGSTIGYTGYSGDCSTTSSFICRYRKLKAAGAFDEALIDTVIVFGGTNDSWSNAPLGEEQYADWQESDLFNVRPAICYFMHTLKTDLPNARIVFIANCDIKEEVVECIKNAGARLDVETVVLNGIEKMSGHPTSRGMEQICDQIIEQLGE